MSTASPTPRERAAGFHDAECARYRADLPYWSDLARTTGGPVADLGAGTGRVSLSLAADGHDVVAVDIDPLLLETLRERAAARGLSIETLAADLTAVDEIPALARLRARLTIIPMQTIQLLAGPRERSRALRAIAARSAAGATLAIAFIPQVESFDGRALQAGLLPPDIASIGDWRFDSTPLAVLQESSAARIDMHRVREIHDRAGKRVDGPEPVLITLEPLDEPTLRAEATAAGWLHEGTDTLEATDDHAGSLIARFKLAERGSA